MCPKKVAFSGPNMLYIYFHYVKISLVVKSLFLEKFNFWDQVCSVQVLPITTGLSYSNRIPTKSVIVGPNVCNICNNHEQRSFLVKSPLLKKWNFLDIVCSVHVVTITTKLR